MTEMNENNETQAASPRDAELIEEYRRNGSQAALSELFARYKKPFYGYLCRMLGNDRMSADDVFQELWIRIIKKLPDCRDPERFSSWGFSIAHNLAIGHFRSVATRRKIGAETPDGELPDPVMEDREERSEEYEEYRLRKLEEAIAKLPPEQLEVVELRRKGVDFKEIARIQSCPLNTALGRMHKAVRFLRSELAGIE